jgi:hypothetical protein
VETVSGKIRRDANLLADFRIEEILSILQDNEARGRIYLLRRNKTLPRNTVEESYLAALRRYVKAKIALHRNHVAFTGGFTERAAQLNPYAREEAQSARDLMDRLEATIRGEIAEWDGEHGFLYHGHFSEG